ncbi:MAG: SDR family NAD(P)-dependent oxidoreductase [Bernardetiaceae bacterium]
MKSTALITGATSGIGAAIARRFAQAGLRLILCGRRAERLQALHQELSLHTQVQTLTFDVRSAEEVFAAVESLPANFEKVDILINNAGNAHGRATIDQGHLDDWDAMIDGNIKGLLYVTKAVVPRMVAAQQGHIINIGSIAGVQVYPEGNVYCATKSAVAALSEAMRLDLNAHHIKVSEIKPGLVETEFSLVRFKGDQEQAQRVYQGYQALHPEDVAELAYFMVSCPAHVNIADVLILPSAQASATRVRRNP